MENPKKKTLGRRKIQIKKIEKKKQSSSCVKSPADKLYSFGQPSVEALINCAAPSPAQIHREYEYEAAAKRLEAEKRRAGGYEGLQLHELEQLLKSLENSAGKVEKNLKNYAPDSLLVRILVRKGSGLLFVISSCN